MGIDADKIAEFFYQIVGGSMAKLAEIEQIFVCIVLVAGANRYAYYIHLTGVSEEKSVEKGKKAEKIAKKSEKNSNLEKNAVITLFYLVEYEPMFTEIVLQVMNSLWNESFLFEVYHDFARHNGMYEFSRISITIWASSVLLNGFSAVEALKILNYSMIPFYGEAAGLLGEGEGEGEVEYGEDFEIDENMLPVGEV